MKKEYSLAEVKKIKSWAASLLNRALADVFDYLQDRSHPTNEQALDFRSALEWIFGDYEDGITINSICDVLDLDKDIVFENVRKRIDECRLYEALTMVGEEPEKGTPLKALKEHAEDYLGVVIHKYGNHKGVRCWLDNKLEVQCNKPDLVALARQLFTVKNF